MKNFSLLLLLLISGSMLHSLPAEQFKTTNNYPKELRSTTLKSDGLVSLMLILLAASEYAPPTAADCVTPYPNPGSDCYCFSNGRLWVCIRRYGLYHCAFHSDCIAGLRNSPEDPIPSDGITLSNWWFISL